MGFCLRDAKFLMCCAVLFMKEKEMENFSSHNFLFEIYRQEANKKLYKEKGRVIIKFSQ